MAKSTDMNTLPVWDIWVGLYHLGQGYDSSTKPELLGQSEGRTFQIACILYELRSMYEGIRNRELKGEYQDHQSQEWFYNRNTNSNSWLGKYYETEAEAWQSFPEHKRPKL